MARVSRLKDRNLKLANQESAPESKTASESSDNTWKQEVVSFLREFLIALVISLLITRFVLIIPLVPTASMVPTINVNERIIVDKLSHYFSTIKRGEIVVFPCPDTPEELYVKRVIGLPGETVTIHDNTVFIDGVPLNEPYLVVDTLGYYGPYHVPEGHIFVMGDNRNTSRDSRAWVTTNYVSLNEVQGRGLAVLWPLNHMRWLH